jgi:septum formation protein
MDIDHYIDSGDWRGKAGGYAIQGTAARFICDIGGSYSNIVGFSLYDVAAMLDAAGWYKAGHHVDQLQDLHPLSRPKGRS